MLATRATAFATAAARRVSASIASSSRGAPPCPVAVAVASSRAARVSTVASSSSSRCAHLVRPESARRAGSSRAWRALPSPSSAASASARRFRVGAASDASSSSSSSSSSGDDTLGALRRRVDALASPVANALDVLDAPRLRATLADLDARASEATLWDDPKNAKAVMEQLADVRERLDVAAALEDGLGDAQTALEMIADDPSSADVPELASEVSDAVNALEGALEAWEARRLLGGTYDALGATVFIYAGAGGTDAQDWSEMLERCYLQWADRRGFAVRVEARTPGDEAGLKSVTLEIEGRYAYGYLASEKGTHRLVRTSPFNKGAFSFIRWSPRDRVEDFRPPASLSARPTVGLDPRHTPTRSFQLQLQLTPHPSTPPRRSSLRTMDPRPEDATRQTSFAAVDVMPTLEDKVRSIHWSPYDPVRVVNADP
jgi:hypothetical protein